MAKDKVVSSTEVRDGRNRVVNPPPPETPVMAASPDGKITFEMYAACRNIPVQRRAGMRVFTNLKVATLTEWDVAFKRY